MLVQVKPYRSKELAALYNISEKTFTAWLNKIRDKLGPQVGRAWNVNQVKFMFNHFGHPETNERNN